MATARIYESEGIVLSLVPQKEKDAMVSLLTEEGFLSFYAHGAHRVGTLPSLLCQELAYGKYVLSESSSHSLTLKEGKLFSLLRPREDLECHYAASAILEFASHHLHEEDASATYPWLKEAFGCLSKDNDPISVLLMFLCASARIGGYGLQVDRCVICGKQQGIVALSPDLGGFVCKDCLEPSMSPNDPTVLKIFRHAYRCPLEDLNRVTYPKKEAREALRILAPILFDQWGGKLHSLEALLSF